MLMHVRADCACSARVRSLTPGAHACTYGPLLRADSLLLRIIPMLTDHERVSEFLLYLVVCHMSLLTCSMESVESLHTVHANSHAAVREGLHARRALWALDHLCACQGGCAPRRS